MTPIDHARSLIRERYLEIAAIHGDTTSLRAAIIGEVCGGRSLSAREIIAVAREARRLVGAIQAGDSVRGVGAEGVSHGDH